MCNFLSAVVLKNGDVLTHPLLDSHSDLVRYYSLPEEAASQGIACLIVAVIAGLTAWGM